jgi:hypothetical protein
MRRILIVLAPAALLALPGQPGGPAPARAQFAGPPPAAPEAARPAPAALPGLTARQAPAPIPADPNASLSPTAALFDAINRGDLAAARDAVTRGASLEERNVLGLTAIEAAVDQGRNDILFFLLSVRPSLRGPQAPPAASLTPAQRAAREREAAQAAREAARAMGAGTGPRGPAPPTRPRLFANDGGAPRPEIGFLGFDAGRGGGTGPAAGGRRG